MTLTLPSDESRTLSRATDLPIDPQTWCRRILTSLSQRKLQEREIGNLEMMLTFLI